MVKPLNPMDLFHLKTFGGAQVSPDGKMVAYVRQHHDTDEEKSFTDIYLADVGTGLSRKLTNSGKDKAPVWFQDSQRLAFISERSGKSQIWLMDVTGGEAWLIPTKQPVQGALTVAPAGNRIFFQGSAFSKGDDWIPYPGCPESDRGRALDQATRWLKPDKDKARDPDKPKPNDIKVLTRLQYSLDGVGYFGDMRTQIFYLDIPAAPSSTPSKPDDSDEVQVTSSDYDHSGATLSPDGKYAIVSALRRDDADYWQKSDLWLFQVEPAADAGSAGNISQSQGPWLLYDGPGPTHNPVWSPSGKWLAFTGHDSKRGVTTRTDLWVLDVEGFIKSIEAGVVPSPLSQEQVLNLTGEIDRALLRGVPRPEPSYGGATRPAVWRDEDLYFGLVNHGETCIYRAFQEPDKVRSPKEHSQAKGTESTHGAWTLQRILGETGTAISGFHIGAKTLAYQASDPITPEDLYVARADRVDDDVAHGQSSLLRGKALGSNSIIRLTDENDSFMADIATGTWEKLQCHADDGQELDYWMMYPQGYEKSSGKKLPTLIMVHGGPHSAYGPAFSFTANLFASHGYIVVYSNPRGSSSYGQEFSSCIDADWGRKDYGDVMACVNAAVLGEAVDEDNLFLYGWSYGGWWTVWAITQTDAFKAACAGACVSNLHNDYGTADCLWANEQEYGGKPWEDADGLLKRSPISYVANVNTPLLLIHGEGDLRCPITNSEQYYAALKRLGKTAVFIRYPGEYHLIKRHLHQIDKLERMLSWFQYYRGTSKRGL